MKGLKLTGVSQSPKKFNCSCIFQPYTLVVYKPENEANRRASSKSTNKLIKNYNVSWGYPGKKINFAKKKFQVLLSIVVHRNEKNFLSLPSFSTTHEKFLYNCLRVQKHTTNKKFYKCTSTLLVRL